MTGETPVLGTLADLTTAPVEHNSLAPREFIPVRMAALIPADDCLPPISPTPRPPRRAGSPPMTSRVAIAVAPVAGTARLASAGGIATSSALQIGESALTGESVPAAKDGATLPGGGVGPGEQSDMAFMYTPTPGSGVVIVTGTGSGTQVGKIAHMLSATAKEETPLTRQMQPDTAPRSLH